MTSVMWWPTISTSFHCSLLEGKKSILRSSILGLLDQRLTAASIEIVSRIDESMGRSGGNLKAKIERDIWKTRSIRSSIATDIDGSFLWRMIISPLKINWDLELARVIVPLPMPLWIFKLEKNRSQRHIRVDTSSLRSCAVRKGRKKNTKLGWERNGWRCY